MNSRNLTISIFKCSSIAVTLFFCTTLLAQTSRATPPGEESNSCIRSVLYSEWRQAKHLYDEGKCAAATDLIRIALQKLAERDESWRAVKQSTWKYYMNCGSMSIIDSDRTNLIQRQKEELEGIEFVKAMLGRDHRELINWFYDYQDISSGKARTWACAQTEPLLEKQISFLDQIRLADQNRSVDEKKQLVRIEEEYLWKLVDVLRKEGKTQKWLSLKEKQADFGDSVWQTEWGKQFPITGGSSWDDVAHQYYLAGNYNKAEAIYRMLLVRACDPAGTKGISKTMPSPVLEQILPFVNKGDYQYTRVMYLDKLKDIYIKENRLDEAEQCVRGKLASMSTFYKADSPAIELVNKELKQIHEKMHRFKDKK